MRKLAAVLLSTMLLFGLTACSSNPQTQNTTAAPSSETENNDTTEAVGTEDAAEPSTEAVTESEPADAGNGKVLVVYYSATGNTEDAANYIAAATNGDVFELIPVEPYTDDDLRWTDENSRVVYEHDHPDDRYVELTAATVEDWASYDTVFIGYPIWWGIAAWPVDEFVKTNDFTGKTVIPFCTSASSGLGQSGELLEEMAGTGTWQEGERFSSSVSEEAIRTWVEGLGL